MPLDILTDEFAQAAATAGLNARHEALADGHPVVFVDDSGRYLSGRYLEERPDGTIREVRLFPGSPRDAHVRILTEPTICLS